MADVPQSAILGTAIRAALAAGERMTARYQTELVVETKSSLADVVTDVDRACEAAIRDEIRKSFPEHCVLGEEGVAPGRDAAVAALAACTEQEHLWIVDPLDGTTNFVHGLPLSVVSIAYACSGELETGVVFDPYRDEVFFAVRGGGAHVCSKVDAQAWLAQPEAKFPGRAMSVSGVGELRRAVMATGMPVRHLERERMMQVAAGLIGRVKSLRTLGAAALHLAYVAAGRIDVFWEFDLNAWDIAAGALLVAEAGGVIETLDEQPYTLAARDVAAGSDAAVLHEVARIMKP
ncbi:myo-inositol-1(or 4)-monophosphatase [Alicyclobacillus sacchari]|uniref:Inositol-1-monophosphatase n=1 Tax=Alicyclobacillus sacchari TaxID=392010 RepID=A0A4R8LS80_9BACL|nr:inositol monophosphatase family protein [Alicyclobacillus sacchari]TDY49557.1 myo-inositol-1(or 4)-monophosphatase [Alicyclobacillus sacchari]GMA58579.1 inositol-1-monophosphatase [Alicyclobacillus sacchari]